MLILDHLKGRARPSEIDLHAFLLQLCDFVSESNRIEDIRRAPTLAEFEAHRLFLIDDDLSIAGVMELLAVIEPGAKLRQHSWQTVTVGDHSPRPGGMAVVYELEDLLHKASIAAMTAFDVHHAYETLHPFTDGNGRTGRAIWLWQMLRQSTDTKALARGFLHTWYYQSLGADRRVKELRDG